MSVMDFLRRRPGDLSPDDPMVRLLSDAFDAARPDPLFRRRLRGEVLNRYVATREGIAVRAAARGRSRMGVIGRSVLYASVALAGSAAVTLAGSQAAMPGDPLYEVKLRIDALRMHAVPTHLRDDLALYTLGQRLDEATVLAAQGDWKGATRAAAEAERSAGLLAALGTDELAEAEEEVLQHVAALEGVLDGAPPEVHAALLHAIEVSTDAGASTTPAEPPANGGESQGGQGQGGQDHGGQSGQGQGGHGGQGDGDRPVPEPGTDVEPSPSPEPAPDGGHDGGEPDSIAPPEPAETPDGDGPPDGLRTPRPRPTPPNGGAPLGPPGS